MSIRQILIILAVVSIFSPIAFCSTEELRVVGGANAVANSAPFVVSFQQNGLHYCSGSIVNANWIVTAAHCLNSKAQVLSTTLVAGSLNVDGSASTTQTRFIDGYVTNDLYLGGTSPYDIGLVYTSNAFIWSNAVAPITLPSSGSTPTGSALLFGWGSISTSNTADYPSMLQVATVSIISESSCVTALGSQGANVHITNICTGPLTGGVGICTSDSGGPLVQTVNGQNVLIGIVSWGKLPCGQPNSPSVYVEVSAFISWISENQNI